MKTKYFCPYQAFQDINVNMAKNQCLFADIIGLKRQCIAVLSPSALVLIVCEADLYILMLLNSVISAKTNSNILTLTY